MIDIHCHILPGVDDGSDSKSESIEMLLHAKSAGISKIVCTPHYHDGSFSQQAVDDAFQWIYAQAHEIGLAICLGYEIHWRKIEEHGLDAVLNRLIDGTSYALIEFPTNSEISLLEQRMLWKLRGKGLTPIIAHPERYTAIQRDLSLAHELKEAGCLLQMSANAISSPFLSGRRKAYKYMVKNGLYDYIASDAHKASDYDEYLKAINANPEIVSNQFDFLA